MERLKPCPFCGYEGTKIYHEDDNSVGLRAGYYLSSHSRCRMSFSGYFDTEKEAADAWNGRYYERRISEDTKTIARELIAAVDSLPWLPEDVSDTVSRFELALQKEAA